MQRLRIVGLFMTKEYICLYSPWHVRLVSLDEKRATQTLKFRKYGQICKKKKVKRAVRSENECRNLVFLRERTRYAHAHALQAHPLPAPSSRSRIHRTSASTPKDGQNRGRGFPGLGSFARAAGWTDLLLGSQAG
jgi:hypothetical protein